MKIRYLSDIHLEFSDFTPASAEADVVVLAGDIGEHTRGLEWAARVFPDTPVVYVAGNHEFYDADIVDMHQELQKRAKALGIHYLENQTVVIEGVRFLGTTLWTDYALYGCTERCMREAKNCMNDHYAIRTPGGHLFQPTDALRRHQVSRGFIRRALNEAFPGKTVVVTHHAPTMQSIAARFKEDLLTAAFASHLEPLVDRADVWIHGHTHNRSLYQVGQCVVVCNPRGYVSQNRQEDTGFQDPAILEI